MKNAIKEHHDLELQNAVAVRMFTRAAEAHVQDPDIDYVKVNEKHYPIHLRGAKNKIQELC